ncbi:MAG TPA: hypothetical protein VJN68_05915 [Burkholderiaceae bacterium]|nr:hypothetical protein [Burkholderiaceae bacterium]
MASTQSQRSPSAPLFARPSQHVRVVAAAVAVVATTVCLGSQIGLLTMYSGEADIFIAKLKPAMPRAVEVAVLANQPQKNR